MDIRINIKPIVLSADTQQMLLAKITDNFTYVEVMTDTGKYLLKGDFKLKSKRVYNLVKVRRKTSGEHKHKKELCRGHWIAYVYDLPNFICVKQKTRNFEITGLVL